MDQEVVNTTNNPLKTSTKTRIGLILIVLGFISPVFALLVPLLELSTAASTGLVGFLLIGGPELFMVLGAALAGKEGVLLVKNWIKRLFGLPEGRYAAPRSQYNFALFLLFLWLLALLLVSYVPGFLDIPFIQENYIYLNLASDLMFLIAIFFVGGNQMVTKFGRLLKWESWTLPPPKEKKKK